MEISPALPHSAKDLCMKFAIPPYTDHGLPFYWINEQSGLLVAAVNAYFNCRAGDSDPSPEQLALFADYIRHWVNAPCFDRVLDLPVEDTQPHRAELAAVRERAKTVQTVEEIARLLADCLRIGIDPL